jgi:hypothetical protein
MKKLIMVLMMLMFVGCGYTYIIQRCDINECQNITEFSNYEECNILAKEYAVECIDNLSCNYIYVCLIN